MTGTKKTGPPDDGVGPWPWSQSALRVITCRSPSAQGPRGISAQNRQTALAIHSSDASVSAISNPWYSAFTVK